MENNLEGNKCVINSVLRGMEDELISHEGFINPY